MQWMQCDAKRSVEMRTVIMGRRIGLEERGVFSRADAALKTASWLRLFGSSRLARFKAAKMARQRFRRQARRV